jgi:hypothetical protein
MRNSMDTPSKSRAWASVGFQLQQAVDRILLSFPDIGGLVHKLRRGQAIDGLDDAVRRQCRSHIFEELGVHDFDHEELPTGPDLAFMELVGSRASDPDADILPAWMDPARGAPLGFNNDIPITGVFPEVAVDDTIDRSDLSTLISNAQDWSNYKSVEEDTGSAWALVETAEANGYCKTFNSESEVALFVGTPDITLQPLGMVSKTKPDGTVKRRLVWDYLRSGTNWHIVLAERLVLPRIEDAVRGARRIHGPRAQTERLEWLVLDFSDAFHHIRLRQDYWRVNVCKVGRKWVVYTSLSFGGKSFPNLWGRTAAFIGRLVGSALQGQAADLQIFVDDPLVAASGTEGERDRVFSTVFVLFAVLNFKVAWQKAALDESVVWIGAQFSYTAEDIRVAIPEDKRAKFVELTSALLEAKATRTRAVRSYAGLASFYAGFIPWLKPFIASVWSALSETDRLHTADRRMKVAKGFAVAMVPTLRYRHALRWLLAFLSGWRVQYRSFRYFEQPVDLNSFIVVDACPWGMGGILVRHHRVVEYYFCRVSSHDVRRFSAKVGESGYTTLWECLALLLAARIWLVNRDDPTFIQVRSDSLGALRMAMKVSSKSPAMNAIAQEIALHMATRDFELAILKHIPGISNEIPDALSRQHAPEPKPFPTSLEGAKRRMAPERTADFWLASVKT